jgi:hypothetical protein
MTARRHGFICLIVALLAAAASPFVLTKFRTVTTAPAAVAAANAAWQSSYIEAPWHKEFSPDNIARYEPYTATLSNGVWSVSGTTPVGIGKDAPKARIRRRDGAADVSYGR